MHTLDSQNQFKTGEMNIKTHQTKNHCEVQLESYMTSFHVITHLHVLTSENNKMYYFFFPLVSLFSMSNALPVAYMGLEKKNYYLWNPDMNRKQQWPFLN